MSVNQQETFTKFKSNKTLDTSKSKQTFFTRMSSVFTDIKTLFLWIMEKINSFLSKCSILTHFIIILIPLSLIFIFLIFYIHLKFYDTLFRFNYYKGVKEEFLDLYITEIDDMHSELETFLMKENYFDVENLLFFEIYFKELISIGLLDNSSEKIFPDISDESNSLYSIIDNFFSSNQISNSAIYTIPRETAKQFLDDRNDSLKELAKVYYYMFPIINYGAYFTDLLIEQSTLLAYEFDESRNIKGEEMYFSFPRVIHPYNPGHNFLLSHGYLNPSVSKTPFNHSDFINNSYYHENFFKMQDSDFRKFSHLDEEGWSMISFSHMNYENNGNITKNLLMSLQLNINRNDRHFIINIIYNLQQKDINDDTIEYTAFLINKDTETHNPINEKYSDNDTFVISKGDFTEYSLTTLDSKFFHYGLYNSDNNFYKNGVNYDNFNIDTLSDPLKQYSTVDGYNIDLKYLSNIYLYTKMFLNSDYSYYKKPGEEISLYIFSDEQKIKQICKELNLSKYIEYIKSDTDIDCWDSQNQLYYDDDYKNVALFDSYASLPHCACLPLYCLNNYKTLKKEKYKFTDENLVSKINLPDRCQNDFSFYFNEYDPSYNNSYTSMMSNYIYNLFNSESKKPENEYIKIEKETLTQLPGFYLFVISEIKSNTQSLFYLFYNTVNKIEIMILIMTILLFTFSIVIVIIYKNLKKISLIIEEFKQKYEAFVYHSVCNDIMISANHDDNRNQNNSNKNVDDQNMYNENIPFLQNDNSLVNELYSNENTLIEDLFSIYCKYYNVCRKQIEEYYSKKRHETKYQMKLKMMTEKNELFKLLCLFSIYAPYFRLNLSLDYKMYNYSKIIKKYDQYVTQVANFDKEQTRLTQNILYELLSTENISDYGLIMNLNFKYVSNINAEFKENSIQHALFKNVINKMKGKNEEKESDINYNDIFFIIKDGDEKQNVKLVLKKKNELMEYFKSKFECDDYINVVKIESSFNFFLINSYYKYLKQISLEENNSK